MKYQADPAAAKDGDGDVAGDILDIDLVSQSFMRDPFPTLARLREAGPVVRVKLPFLGKTWLATTHEAVNKVLKDDEHVRPERQQRGKTSPVRALVDAAHPPRPDRDTCSGTTTLTTAACAGWSIRRSTATASRA